MSPFCNRRRAAKETQALEIAENEGRGDIDIRRVCIGFECGKRGKQGGRGLGGFLYIGFRCGGELVESPKKQRESSTELLPHASLKARVLTDPTSLFFDLFRVSE